MYIQLSLAYMHRGELVNWC